MGLIGTVLGAREVAGAVGELAEVFAGNRAEREAAEAAMGQAAVSQYEAEFQQAPQGWFDSFMNGLNRLPRPLLVVGTFGLFAYSMISPEEFARRMESLALVPEPLWWLLGAIVSFYFGARELHYTRNRRSTATAVVAGAAAGRKVTSGKATAKSIAAKTNAPKVTGAKTTGARATRVEAPRPGLGGLFAPRRTPEPAIEVKAGDPKFNAALEEWRATRR